jgi:hydroxymethylglutaryl-CoA synthase
MHGIVGYGAYLPHWRIDRKTIGEALGVPGGRGTRGVEAARAALRGAGGLAPAAVYFATAAPPYLDKTNATAIHAALNLDAGAAAYDMLGAVRSGAGVLRAALDAAVPTLAVCADIRTGLPAGADERDGGDGAAAFLCADAGAGRPVLAEVVAHASASAEFLERWRLPGEPASRQWEERFGEHALVPLAELAITEALKRAGVTIHQIGRVVVTGPHGRAARRAAAGSGAKAEAIADDLTGVIGHTGAAHAGLLLADALDRAGADQLILAVSVSDGADATVWRATGALAAARPASPRAAPTPSARRRRRRCAPRTGSSASPAAGAPRAGRGTCRPSASASSARPWTAWPASPWPTCPRPSPPSPWTGSPTRCRRPWWRR